MEESPPPKRHKPPLQNPHPPTISQTLITDDGDVVEEDRISNLPDSILSHILSKLPTRNALATTVLSTKWKHLFASIPNLSLAINDSVSIHQANPNFVNFMHHLLTVTLRDVPSIRKFRLHCHHDYGNSHIDAWISAVLGLKVSDLTLFFHVKDTGVSVESLFQSETLVRLIWCQQFYADVPDTAIHRSSCTMPTFSNMTELKLGDLNSHGWEFLPHLLESAPNLETLVLRGFMENEGCFANFESSIPNHVPTCLSLKLQFIYFEGFNGEQDEIDLVSYFLTTAEVLREMEFSFCSSLPIEKQYNTWSNLKSLESCSKSKNCKIHFTNGISLLQSFVDWMKSISSERRG